MKTLPPAEAEALKQLDDRIESIIIEAIFMTAYDKSIKHPELYPAKAVNEELDRILPLGGRG